MVESIVHTKQLKFVTEKKIETSEKWKKDLHLKREKLDPERWVSRKKEG